VALGRVFSEYFGFPRQSSFHQILHHHNHLGQATIGQLVATVPSGPSWTPHTTKRIKKKCLNSVGTNSEDFLVRYQPSFGKPIATGHGLNGQWVGFRAPVKKWISSSSRRPDLLWGSLNFPSNGQQEYNGRTETPTNYLHLVPRPIHLFLHKSSWSST
jgi:hypothetical protein